jgi:hypothetical protein
MRVLVCSSTGAHFDMWRTAGRADILVVQPQIYQAHLNPQFHSDDRPRLDLLNNNCFVHDAGQSYKRAQKHSPEHSFRAR